ncbi:CTP synthetase [Pararhodobacter sp.]|uniref:CTP synthetase n=1 Tax=Pararhodobacter sp. TaxID=2127056 RepID=UPI002AFE7886|nr:CTP synthetase [Pararhodobacter sp.]
MLRLTSILYAVVGTTLAGIAIVVALTMNMYDVQSIVWAAVIGSIVALPVSWLIAKKLKEL